MWGRCRGQRDGQQICQPFAAVPEVALDITGYALGLLVRTLIVEFAAVEGGVVTALVVRQEENNVRRLAARDRPGDEC